MSIKFPALPGWWRVPHRTNNIVRGLTTGISKEPPRFLYLAKKTPVLLKNFYDVKKLHLLLIIRVSVLFAYH
jgi:hypothetical protein